MDHFRKEFDREMDVDTAIFCYHTYRGTKRCGTVCFFVDLFRLCVFSVECLNWKTKETNSLQFQLRNWEAMKKRIGEVNTSRDL
jgi:hypothetical protein